MKLIRSIPLLLLLAAITFAGCKKTACFTIENEGYLNPRYPIQFRNCSERADEYLWDFGDGETSFLEEPTHIYQHEGEYEITLTATHGSTVRKAKKTLNLQYAFIEVIRVVSINPTKPNGDPWDPNGSGPDIKLSGRDWNSPPWAPYFSPFRVIDMPLPYDFGFSNLTINFDGLIITMEEWNDPGDTDHDTVCTASREFAEFADAPYERVDCGGAVYEFYMTHH